MRSLARMLSAVVVALAVAMPAGAFDRTDIPLKNWGGFAIHRDAVYDDLERLVTAGLADRTLLSTKPISRIAAARIVATAVEKIRRDDGGQYNSRRDLEPLVARLTEEFRSELASLGVRVSDPGPPANFVSFVPVDRAQGRAGFTSRDLKIPDSQGLKFERGLNGGTTFESRMQIGDMLTFYVQPELLANEEDGAARLATGYAKLTLFNVQLLLGRESLWWGPGLRGSLVLSNNAAPLDQVRLQAAEPFLLPIVGEWVGPMNLLFFGAVLEERRDDPHAKLAGMRATISPLSFLELGISRLVMLAGDTSPRLSGTDYATVLFKSSAGDLRTGSDLRFRNNNLFAIDAELRLPGVDRYRLPAKDVRLYGEFGWDDACCNTSFIPKREATAFILGAHWLGLFGQEGLEVRAEHAWASDLSFIHDQFSHGYATRGHVISHFMGTGGADSWVRVQGHLSQNLMLGGEASRTVIGSTRGGLFGDVPQERRLGGAADVSYSFAERMALFARYDLVHVKDRDFRRGVDGLEHVLRLEVTRKFR